MKNIVHHVKKHHKKYVGGFFASYAVMKTFVLLAGFLGLIGLAVTLVEPVASNVTIETDAVMGPVVGSVVTGQYTYTSDSSAWELVGTAGFSTGEATYTSLAVDNNGTSYVAYIDAGYNQRVVIKKYNSGNSTWEMVGSSPSSPGAQYPSLKIANDGVPYIAYRDEGGGTKVSVKKYNSGSNTWSLVGVAGFSSGTADYISLSLANDGTPYVAYKDVPLGRATVMKYDGSSWVLVGSRGFSDGTANYTSLVVDTTGNLYVGYQDIVAGKRATVMTYDGAAWVALGPKGFSDNMAEFVSLVVSVDGVPYIVYKDSEKATVMKYNTITTVWKPVGLARFSSGSANYTTIRVYNENTLYVAYQDDNAPGGNQNKATVMTYNTGSSLWEPLGTPAFSSPSASYIAMDISPDGIPYISYADHDQGNEITVMNYASNPTEGASVYQWYKDERGDGHRKPIAGATNKIYTVSSHDQRTYLKFEVTPVSPSGESGASMESDPIYIDAPRVSNVHVVGTPYVGNILTGEYTYIYGDTEGNSLYRWFRDGELIVDATGISYTVTSLDAGKTLLFAVYPNAQLGGFGDAGLSTSVLVNAFPVATGVTISGTAIVGNTLIGQYSYSDIDTLWGSVGLSGVSSGDAGSVSLVVFDGTPYVAYIDGLHDNQATVMKYNGTIWVPVGDLSVLAARADQLSLSVSASGSLYLVYRAKSYGGAAIVMKYDGTSWSPLGTEGFSDGGLLSLAVHNEIPYVAYLDGGKVTVMTYTGTSWVFVGNSAFSPGVSPYFSLKIATDGTPYVAFQNEKDNYKAMVMKYTSGTDLWEPVGAPGFSSGFAGYISLALDNNIPYVAYSDNSDINKATVMKYTETSWKLVGNSAVSSGHADHISLVVNAGAPYLAYVDTLDTNRVKVMKYTGTSWELVGNSAVSSNNSNYITSLAVSDDAPYIAYRDGDSFKATLMKFFDNSEDIASNQRYQWYSDGAILIGATGLTYQPTSLDVGNIIIFEVTPIAINGSSPGIPVQSTGVVVSAPAVVPTTPTGGGTILHPDTCSPQRDCSSSYYDNLCGPCTSTGTTTTHGSASCDVTNSPYSPELTSAFTFAYDLGITTQCPIAKANLTDKVIRSHFAKMVTEFAIKVLKKQPNTKLACTFADVSNESSELNFYMKTACQLGLMGRESDGKSTQKNFNPKDTMTRAQLGTVLSRLLYGNVNNSTDSVNWYTKHLQALNKNGIMNDISKPKMEEIRGFILLMFQRAAK